jgi:hypothetical protein
MSLTGNLTRFGYDTAGSAVVVRYDAALSTAGGTGRRDPALRGARAGRRHRRQRSARRSTPPPTSVALEVAQWVGG